MVGIIQTSFFLVFVTYLPQATYYVIVHLRITYAYGGNMKFKIGYFQWIIKLVKYKLSADDGCPAYGITYKDDQVIKVEIIKNKQMEKETVMHEILNACFEDNDLVSDEIEEKLILAMSPRLMEVQDNKKIRDYLFGGKK